MLRGAVAYPPHLVRIIDHGHEPGHSGIGLRIDQLDARRRRARHHEISARLGGTWRVATAASPAGVPAKAEKSVRVARKLETPDDLPKGSGVGRRVDDPYPVALMQALRGETNVRELFD